MRKFSIMFPPFAASVFFMSCADEREPSPDAAPLPLCASIGETCVRQGETDLACVSTNVCHCNVGSKAMPDIVACRLEDR